MSFFISGDALFQSIIVEHPTSGQCLSNSFDLFSSRIQSILECLSHFVSNSVSHRVFDSLYFLMVSLETVPAHTHIIRLFTNSFKEMRNIFWSDGVCVNSSPSTREGVFLTLTYKQGRMRNPSGNSKTGENHEIRSSSLKRSAR